MILMKYNSRIECYRNVMSSIDVPQETKLHIIEYCAKRSTYKRIKSRKFGIVAVKKEKEHNNTF